MYDFELFRKSLSRMISGKTLHFHEYSGYNNLLSTLDHLVEVRVTMLNNFGPDIEENRFNQCKSMHGELLVCALCCPNRLEQLLQTFAVTDGPGSNRGEDLPEYWHDGDRPIEVKTTKVGLYESSLEGIDNSLFVFVSPPGKTQNPSYLLEGALKVESLVKLLYISGRHDSDGLLYIPAYAIHKAIGQMRESMPILPRIKQLMGRR